MNKKLKSRYYLPVIAASFWFFALYPGRLGFDGAEAIRMIQRGESTDWWGASFFWFLRLTTFEGQTIAIAAAIQCIVLFCSLKTYINSLPVSKSVSLSTLLILVSTPFFGFFATGISHDVFLVSGILLVLAEENRRLYKLESNRRRFKTYFHNASILILLSMTKIGLLIFVAYSLIWFVRKHYLKATALLIVGIIFYIISSIGITSQASGYYLWPAFADLKCIAQHTEADISDKQWSWLNKYADEELWKRPISCSSMDQAVESLGFESHIEISVDRGFIKNYLAIVKQNPAIVVMAHINRSRVALPPPFFPVPDNQVDLNSEVPVGQGTNTALQSGPEILHPSIDEPSVKINKGIFSLPEQIVQIPTLLINQASWFWGWGGMWLWLVGYFLISRSKETRISRILIANWPTFLLHATLVLLAPNSLPRYVMSTIYCGLIAAIAISLEWKKKREHEKIIEKECPDE